MQLGAKPTTWHRRDDLGDPSSITKILTKIMLILAVLRSYNYTTTLIRGTSSWHFWKTFVMFPYTNFHETSGQRDHSLIISDEWFVYGNGSPNIIANIIYKPFQQTSTAFSIATGPMGPCLNTGKPTGFREGEDWIPWKWAHFSWTQGFGCAPQNL